MSTPTPPDDFDLNRLREQLNTWELHYFPELDSTNDWALRTFRVQPPERPCLVVAQMQTRGRGRGSHTWQAPAGNLTCSFAFSLAVPADLAAASTPTNWPAQLALAAGVSVLETIQSRLPAGQSQIKWPNDVLIGGRKVAGILIESPHPAAESDAPHFKLVVIGVGLNANSTPSLASLDMHGQRAIHPTSLAAECRRPIDLTELLLEMSSNLANWLGALGLLSFAVSQPVAPTSSFSELRQRYERALAWRGELVVLQRGDSQLVGKLLGVDAAGQLLVQPAGEPPVAAASGELRLAEPGEQAAD